MEQKWCRNCRSPLSGGRFCPYCGFDNLRNDQYARVPPAYGGNQPAGYEGTVPLDPGGQQVPCAETLPLGGGQSPIHGRAQGGEGQPFSTAPVEPGAVYTAPIPVARNQAGPAATPVTKSRRVRKLPILLLALVCLAAVLLFPKEEKEAPGVTPLAQTAKPSLPAQERLIFEYEAEDLSVTVNENREVTITASNLPLRGQYTVNLPYIPDKTYEFEWAVYAYTPTRTVEFTTHHVKRRQEPENMVIPLSDMTTALYMPNEGGDVFFCIWGVPVDMTHGSNSITWTCTLPEYYPDAPDKPFPVDLSGFTGFEVVVSEYGEPTNKIHRKYTVE